MYFLCFRKKNYKILLQTQFQLREDGEDGEEEEVEEEEHGDEAGGVEGG